MCVHKLAVLGPFLIGCVFILFMYVWHRGVYVHIHVSVCA